MRCMRREVQNACGALEVVGHDARRVGPMPIYSLRPNLYRTMRVVLSNGSTFRLPVAVRTVGEFLPLERDPANHPIYQVSRQHE